MKSFILLVLMTVTVTAAPGKWARSITASLAHQGGNTELMSFSGVLSAEYDGDIKLGSLKLKDTEVKLTLAHKRGELSDALYQHDGGILFLFDIMAHHRFSPFFLSYWSYDSTTALDRRIQLGAGGKYSLMNGVSISVAYLWEGEEYRNETLTTQFRWSVRPKYKKTFDNGVIINYLIFFQPLVQESSAFLIDNRFSLSIPTFTEKLKLAIIWSDKYNSRPPENVKKRDTDINIGFTLSF